MGEKIGVFIPIGDWHILTQKFDNIAIPTYPSMVKEKYKKGLLKSLKEVDTDIKSKVKLQSANDFIKEMRAAAK